MLMQTFRIMHRTPLVLATALLTSVSAFAQTEINDEAGLKATKHHTIRRRMDPYRNIRPSVYRHARRKRFHH